MYIESCRSSAVPTDIITHISDSAIEMKELSDGDAVLVNDRPPMLAAETDEMRTARATASFDDGAL